MKKRKKMHVIFVKREQEDIVKYSLVILNCIPLLLFRLLGEVMGACDI